MFLKTFGRSPNLIDPQSFNENLQIYKLIYRDTSLVKIVDKSLVRDCVSSKIGDEFLVPTLGIYRSFESIPFDIFPEQFILKATHGSGWNLLCLDKHTFDFSNTEFLIDK